MQIQTTTIETTTQTALGANFQIITFEQKTTAFCDLCDSQATGTKSELNGRGWHLGQNEQFCPACN